MTISTVDARTREIADARCTDTDLVIMLRDARRIAAPLWRGSAWVQGEALSVTSRRFISGSPPDRVIRVAGFETDDQASVGGYRQAPNGRGGG